MLIRKNRLTGSRDFKAVYAKGRTFVHRLAVLKVLSKPAGQPSRYGFSTSSKLGKAVVRNRAKRLFRESVRLLDGRLKQSGYDVVLIARPPVCGLKLPEVRSAVEELFRKSRLLTESEHSAESR